MEAIINSRIVTKETVLTGHVLVYDESGIQQIVSTDNFQAGKCRVITDGSGYIA
ncbi:MAG: N-acetylglucosamine-6-phosphate deacetylase, partial [Megasphaera micronuciformis]|nr:N-acetylglucosamine-6-phosphate deacetylase [Megasphaera micronuciformis]